jgi:hypothetical protein
MPFNLPARSRLLSSAAAASFILLAVATPALATIWAVDSAQSYVRLSIPDQTVTVDGVENLTIRVRDANNTSAWTDNGGRRAFLDGMIFTNDVPGVSIAFQDQFTNVYAAETFLARPNPGAFDPNATDSENPNGQYTNTSSAQAVFPMHIRTPLGSVGYAALKDVTFDFGNESLPLSGGTAFSGGSFSLASAKINLDGLVSPFYGQLFPDTRDTVIGPWTGISALSGSISGEPIPKTLTLSIDFPFQFQLGDAVLDASVTGQIVAYNIIPEPSSIAMAGLAVLGLCWAGRRRFRSHA